MEKEKLNYSEIDFWIGFGTVKTIKGNDNYKIIFFKNGKLKIEWQDKSTFIKDIHKIQEIRDIILKYKKELINLSNIQEENGKFLELGVCFGNIDNIDFCVYKNQCNIINEFEKKIISEIEKYLNNVNYFENGVNEFKKGNYEQAEKEFENNKQILFLKDGEMRFYCKEIGNPYLAFMHYYGVGTKIDYEKAWKEAHYIGRGNYHDIDIWKEYISKDIVSKFLVAKMFYNGKYVEKNIVQALGLFKSIADEWKIEEIIENSYLFKIILEEYKDIDAQYLLGLIYFYKGKYKDKKYIEEAENIFKKLAIDYGHFASKEKLEEIKEL